MEKKGKVS